MPNMTDLSAFLNEDAIKPTIKSPTYPQGKEYVIPSPDARTGLSLTAMTTLGMRAANGEFADNPEAAAKASEELELDDDDERNLYQRVLGSAYDELIADDVPWTAIQKLGQYCLIYYGMSPTAANRALETGALLGEASGPNREQRRHPGKAPQDRPASTASKIRSKKRA